MEYDVAIVGARVAGASLALLLGRQGHRVLLLDRDRFPSDTLSTHLLQPAAVALLERLGVLEEVEELGLRRISRLRACIEDCAFEGPISGAVPGYALAPRRDWLDAILLRRALDQAGVELLEGTAVEGLLWDQERVAGVRLKSRSIPARIVVGADGKDSHVARWVEAETYIDLPSTRPIYYAYCRGLVPFPEPAMEIHFH